LVLGTGWDGFRLLSSRTVEFIEGENMHFSVGVPFAISIFNIETLFLMQSVYSCSIMPDLFDESWLI